MKDKEIFKKDCLIFIFCLLFVSSLLTNIVCIDKFKNKHTQLAEEHKELIKLNSELVKENNRQKEELKYLKRKFTMIVECTAYSPHIDQCDGTPEYTAIMERSKPGWHIAVSHDMSWMLGKRVYIESLGIKKVADLMNIRYNNRIDIMFPTKEQAKKFGVKKLKITVLDE